MISATPVGPRGVRADDGRHTFLSDLKPDVGGLDEGPDPHELVEAALAACTLQTMAVYGARKGWSLGTTAVTIRVVEEGPTLRIAREIRFDPTLPADQVERLAGIAEKCPIHKLLRMPTTIETVAVGPAQTTTTIAGPLA